MVWTFPFLFFTNRYSQKTQYYVLCDFYNLIFLLVTVPVSKEEKT